MCPDCIFPVQKNIFPLQTNFFLYLCLFDVDDHGNDYTNKDNKDNHKDSHKNNLIYLIYKFM